MRTPPSLLFNRKQHVSGSVETKLPPEETFQKRFVGRDMSKRRFTKAQVHRGVPTPQTVNIKNIFSEEDVASCASDDSPASDEGIQEEDLEEGPAAVPHLVARSAAMSAFQSKLRQYEADSFEYSAEDWKQFQLEACAENPHLHKSWETLCMQLMYHSGYAKLAASLVSYLSTAADSPPKISTLCLYIALQGEYGGEDKEEIILETFQKVQEMSDVFDAITAKYLISGLATTSQWQKTLDILEMAKLTASPGTAYFSPIIAAAIREGDLEMAFQLLDELASKGFEPQDKVLRHIIHECEKAGSHDLMERFLACVWRYNWPLSPTKAKQVELYYTKLSQEKWSCKWATVNTVRGTCHACRQNLDRIELASSDFEALQREFLERTLVGSNVYLKTNPAELEKFQDFVMEHAPFDVVLDALNIAMRGSGKFGLRRSTQLREIVHYFARERHMKVLVIGRAHMKRWPSADMAYIRRNAKVFFTENISSDDPFLLYATLYSGRDCLFVSGDFMRDHKYNLGPGFKDIFERWQKSRQIVNFVAQADGVSVSMPSQYDCGPVKDEKGWHIPYDDGTSGLRSSSQSVLCLRYKGERAAPRQQRKQTDSDQSGRK
ncbi:hypothetical protein V1264_019412 [Littorina saxatilis]